MTDIKRRFIEKLKSKTDDEIYEEFRDLLIEKLDEEQFWKYVASWKETDSIIEDMLEWDTETQRDAIIEIKEMFNLE